MRLNELVNSIVFRVSGQSAFRAANREIDRTEDVARDAADGVEEFERGMGRAERAGRALGTGIRRVGGTVRNFVGGILGTLPAVLGVGSLGFAGLGAAAISAASDTQEAQSLMQDILGENARDLEEWALRNSRSFNSSDNELRMFASGFATQFRGLTDDLDEVVNFSQTFTGRALDLASQRNRNAADVVNDLTSALNGSSETVQRYGVNLRESAVAQFILTNGLARSRGEITETDRRLARYQIILRDTADAQGNAARTAGDFANVLRNLRGRFNNLLSGVGERLIPIATEILESITTGIETNQAAIIDFFDRMASRVQTFIENGGLQDIARGFGEIAEFAIAAARAIDRVFTITERARIRDDVIEELDDTNPGLSEFNRGRRFVGSFIPGRLGDGAREARRSADAFIDRAVEARLRENGLLNLASNGGNGTNLTVIQNMTVDASNTDAATTERAVSSGASNGVRGFQRITEASSVF